MGTMFACDRVAKRFFSRVPQPSPPWHSLPGRFVHSLRLRNRSLGIPLYFVLTLRTVSLVSGLVNLDTSAKLGHEGHRS